MDQHIYKLDDDMLFLTSILAPYTGERLERLEQQVAGMEQRLENLSNVFITLVKRLQTIIDIKERENASVKDQQTTTEERPSSKDHRKSSKSRS